MPTAADQLAALLRDSDGILQAIEADPQLKIGKSTIAAEQDAQQLEDILREDSSLTKLLTTYNQYKVLSDLINEFNTNYEYNELENCYFSLQNLHKKLQEVNISGESLRFQQSVVTYIDCLHLNLLEKLKSTLAQFWTLTSETATYKQFIENQTVTVTFDELITQCEDQFFNLKMIDRTHWFISSTSLQDYKDQEIALLQDILNDYVKLTPFINFCKQFAFTETNFLVKKETGVISIASSTTNALEKIKSYSILLDFILHDLSAVPRASVIMQLGNTLLTELSKVIRKNLEMLFNDKEAMIDTISKINATLRDISANTEWVYDDFELKRILQDENIFTTLKLESIIQARILEIRRIPEEEYNRLITLPTNSTTSKGNGNTSSRTLDNDQIQESWEWEEEENDGWAEELDLDIDEVSLEVSAFTKPALEAFNKFEEECESIGKSKLQAIYPYKFNLLQTTFFAMFTNKAADWTQLYKDVKYLYETNPQLTQLVELDSRYLETNLSLLEKKAYQLITAQLSQLKDNEHNPDWTITFSSILPYIKETVLPTLCKLEDNSVLVSLVTFIVHETVLANILQWRIISERSSENLSEFITLLLSAVDIPRLNFLDSYRHSREKLSIVGKILTAHLKDILDMFYEGEFFLFATDEIIQWIILLFADTSTRRDCIDEIRRVREEAEDES